MHARRVNLHAGTSHERTPCPRNERIDDVSQSQRMVGTQLQFLNLAEVDDLRKIRFKRRIGAERCNVALNLAE